jgi:hypothetical protein
MKEQCKEEMLASKNKQIIEKIKRDHAKHVRSKEKAMKKQFNEAWITKHCIEVSDMLHATIKINEPLFLHAYQVPFCGIMHAIYKFNMTKTMRKERKTRRQRCGAHNVD